MKSLQEITGCESGAVIVGREYMALNWGNTAGMMRRLGSLAAAFKAEEGAKARYVGDEGLTWEETGDAIEAALGLTETWGDYAQAKIAGAWRIGDAIVVTFKGWD